MAEKKKTKKVIKKEAKKTTKIPIKKIKKETEKITSELNERQKIFCHEYLKEFNATQSYIKAYKAEYETAKANGYRLLANAHIQAYIQKIQENRRKRLEITQDKVLEEIAKIAFLNTKDFYKEDGTLKEIHELDDTIASCISNISVQHEKTERTTSRKNKY